LRGCTGTRAMLQSPTFTLAKRVRIAQVAVQRAYFLKHSE
jgi:hypothetical protein